MRKPSLLAVCLVLSLAGAAQADVRLPRVFTSHMVLQQELPLAVFGWADAGEKVNVEFNGKSAETTTAADGCWEVALPAMKADNTPHTLSIQGKNKIEFTDCLLGEVWLGVGQSNMSRGLRFAKDRALKEKIDFPDYRLFHVVLSRRPREQDIAESMGWAPATHDSMKNIFVHPSAGPYEFSEVTFYFGKRLHEELKVPVGMISASFPGSLVAEWTPQEKPEEKFDFKSQKDQKGPGIMYHSMLQGIPPLTIRGVVWYQGEGDAQDKNYEQDLTRLIEIWRARFHRHDMPFYMVQIAQTTYMGGMLNMWRCETGVMDDVPHTGLAPSNDLWDHGDKKKVRKDARTGFPVVAGGDPHPPNKNIVALCAADIALKETYGSLSREVFGPMVESQKVKGDKIVVKFKHAGEGLKTDDGQPPNWFEVTADPLPEGGGPAPKFVAAQARVVGKDSVEVWSDVVKSPRSVRFAWHPLARHNLYNAEGLPAIPFDAGK